MSLSKSRPVQFVPSPDEVLNALEQIAQHGTAPRRAAAVVDVGSSEFLKYFETEITNGLLASGGATCKVIAGSYGSGKTHLLDLLEDQALRGGLLVVRTDLSQALDLTSWRALTRHILENLECDVNGVAVKSLPGIL